MALPPQFASKLAVEANGNLRKALLMLESSKATQYCIFHKPHLTFCRYPFTADSPVQRMDWEVFIESIASQILSDQSPARFVICDSETKYL